MSNTLTVRDDELAALREAIRDVLATQADRTAIRKIIDTGAAVDHALWRQAAELGWFGLGITEDDGGIGLGIKAILVLCEELGRSVAPLPAIGALLAAEALSRAGSPAQRAALLPKIAAGARPAALALPSAAPLPLLSEQMVLSGQIDLVLDAAGAELLIIPASRADGSLAFLALDVASHGVIIMPRPMADLTRQCAGLCFPDLVLDESVLLTGNAAALVETMSGFASQLLAADSLGAANGIFAATVDYLKMREQFGKAIGSFQALKHRAADHHVALTAARVFLDNAAELWETAVPGAALHASLGKAYVCGIATSIAVDAIQMHGGIGFTWDHECHLFLKRAMLNELLFGAATAHLDHAAALLAEAFAVAA